jgi:hypothetical protein
MFLPVAQNVEAKEQDEGVKRALRQSWRFRAAGEVYKQCDYSLLMSNIMSSPLSHRVRREIIVNAVLAVLDCIKIDLIYWRPTQQMLSPEYFQKEYADPEELANPLTGFLNVRFFNLVDSDGEMVIDTLGLSALGLTDFQMHFRKLEPDPVALFLANLGGYAFDKGDVIESGHTIQGIDGAPWKCQREDAMIEPKRQVIDVNPGKAFAAGERN